MKKKIILYLIISILIVIFISFYPFIPHQYLTIIITGTNEHAKVVPESIDLHIINEPLINLFSKKNINQKGIYHLYIELFNNGGGQIMNFYRLGQGQSNFQLNQLIKGGTNLSYSLYYVGETPIDKGDRWFVDKEVAIN